MVTRVKEDPDSESTMSGASRQGSINGLPSSGTTVLDQMHINGYRIPTVEDGSSEGGNDGVLNSTPMRIPYIVNQEDSVNVLGREVKDLIQAINELQRLGVETTSLQLPKIVVVGDQSAGKSSVIEAISEITVPRSSGTCTRCPLQITTAPADDPGASWICNVYIMRKYDLYPVDHVSRKEHHFAPWVEREPEKTLFTTVKDKRALGEVLWRAQFAVLNPNDHPSMYLKDPISTFNRQEDFSPNYVSLDITEPGLPNLSFFDLPGVINQTEDSDKKYHIKLVKRLVKDYVDGENTLVLLACSMEGDIANSAASGIVRDMKAEHRCIGVLTKPDRLPKGDPLQLWSAVLNGDKYRVGHSYFVTKQPSQDEIERKFDHAQARAAESRFFELQAPWTTKFAPFRERFGTPQLQKALSKKLAMQIVVSLPSLKDKVNTRIAEIQAEIARYPEPPANASNVIQATWNSMMTQVKACINGAPSHPDFRRTLRKRIAEFKGAIEDGKPTLFMRSTAERKAMAKFAASTTNGSPLKRELSVVETISVDSDSEVGSPMPIDTTPTKKRKAGSTVVPVMSGSGSAHSTPQKTKRAEKALGRKFTLDDIRQKLDDHQDDDIPTDIPKEAVNKMRLESLQFWAQPVAQLMQVVNVALKAKLDSVIEERLRQWTTTELYREIRRVVHEFVDKHVDEQRNVISQNVLRLENRVLTQNTEAYEQYRTQALQFLQVARFEARATMYLEKAKQELSAEARAKKIQSDKTLPDTLGPDMFYREVEVMAEIRGYYKLASLRFTDVIVQNLYCVLLDHFLNDLEHDLANALHIYADDVHEYSQRLLAEDPQRENRRLSLKKEMGALEMAKQRLDNLEYKHGDIDGSGLYTT